MRLETIQKVASFGPVPEGPRLASYSGALLEILLKEDVPMGSDQLGELIIQGHFLARKEP
jgi:hypothetical protein